MSVSEGVEFFQNIPSISRHLVTLEEVRLGYIKLGQPSTRLSGGEARRVKAGVRARQTEYGQDAVYPRRADDGRTSRTWIKARWRCWTSLDAGNTVVVIEHNLDVIKRADHIIDLGPDGGDRGGTIVTTGTPEEGCRVPAVLQDSS